MSRRPRSIENSRVADGSGGRSRCRSSRCSWRQTRVSDFAIPNCAALCEAAILASKGTIWHDLAHAKPQPRHRGAVQRDCGDWRHRGCRINWRPHSRSAGGCSCLISGDKSLLKRMNNGNAPRSGCACGWRLTTISQISGSFGPSSLRRRLRNPAMKTRAQKNRKSCGTPMHAL